MWAVRRFYIEYESGNVTKVNNVFKTQTSHNSLAEKFITF